MNKGFSIIELLISVSILIFVNTLILASYPKFIEMVNLNQASQIVASSIRRAQVYGMTIKEEAPDVFPSHGIYFDKSLPSTYILFADLNNNNQYDGFLGELSETYSVSASIYIYQLCDHNDVCNLNDLSVVFRRPLPDIFLYGDAGARGAFDYAKIVLKSPRGREKSVVVWKTGQISVE